MQVIFSVPRCQENVCLQWENKADLKKRVGNKQKRMQKLPSIK